MKNTFNLIAYANILIIISALTLIMEIEGLLNTSESKYFSLFIILIISLLVFLLNKVISSKYKSWGISRMHVRLFLYTLLVLLWYKKHIAHIDDKAYLSLYSSHWGIFLGLVLIWISKGIDEFIFKVKDDDSPSTFLDSLGFLLLILASYFIIVRK